MSAENMLPPPVGKPDYALNNSYNSETGLRSAELTVTAGWPTKFLGKYVFKEWTYGERLNAEIGMPVNESGGRDFTQLLTRQCLVTIRESPLPLNETNYPLLPARVATLLSNVVTYINMSPEPEKN
jgi:hypothetical protein